MKPVDRAEIVDFQTYEDERKAFREAVLACKAVRRLQLGDSLTLLFENRLTVRYQIQEMMRVERIVREADIRHEIETYNELLGGPGGIGATLLVEIEDPRARREKLARWQALPERIYLLLPGGERVHAKIDERQRGDAGLSAVQYLRFDVRGIVPLAAGVDFTEVSDEVKLEPGQREALAEDLAT